jgi:hypothetical protein
LRISTAAASQSIFVGFILHFSHLSAAIAFQEQKYRNNHKGDDEKYPNIRFSKLFLVVLSSDTAVE